MTSRSKKPVQPVTKPYLTGAPTEERTWKSALGFFGTLVLFGIFTFLICSMMNMDSLFLRILLNGAVEGALLFFLYSNAAGKGAEAVARGEILWQKQERGSFIADSERRMSYHPAKGFLVGLLGSVPLLLCAIALAIIAKRQETGIGALPSWLSSYQGRSEIGDALVAYTSQTGATAEDILRLIVRISTMPFVSMVGATDRDGMLLLERLSPILVLLPALAYGLGYTRGPAQRSRILTGIAEGVRKQKRREKKERKARHSSRGPEQLN